MFEFFANFLAWLRSLFFKTGESYLMTSFAYGRGSSPTVVHIPRGNRLTRYKEMELTLVGLQNSGKTTLVNVIAVCPCLPITDE
jgi:hypothetical protein